MNKYFSVEKFKYLFYVLGHPMDGFYEIRHRDSGSVPIALLVTFMFPVVDVVKMMCASFVVNDMNPREIDFRSYVIQVFAAFFLFCVANWSITCLMNGEGRLKDIVTVVGYSLLPIIIAEPIATLVSRFISDQGTIFYSLILYAGVVWAVIMAIIGIMTIHHYSSGKTVLTLLLTVVAMLIIVFLILMLATLVDQVEGFFHSIYTELKFRS